MTVMMLVNILPGQSLYQVKRDPPFVWVLSLHSGWPSRRFSRLVQSAITCWPVRFVYKTVELHFVEWVALKVCVSIATFHITMDRRVSGVSFILICAGY